MEKYGLTENGVNIKRLDVIVDEMHEKLSAKLGVNTKQNPQSLLNHLLTNIADEIAELWEYGSNVYYSQYPASAEGVSLDNALQFGGITREMPAKSYYHILCTGLDGTVIPKGTMISTETNPATNLLLNTDEVISRTNFNKAVIISVSNTVDSVYSVVINGNLYSANNLSSLSENIKEEGFTVSYDNEKLLISATDETSVNTLVLSENLTTETVSSVVTFATEEYGDIAILNNIITKIVKAVPGLQSVTNVGSYVAGRLLETDVEFRQSHVDKIFRNSSRMLESIRSAILSNVQGVQTVAVYENDTNIIDELGRPPHSIEVVVDGGDKTEIARQIFDTKAGGITTFRNEDESGVTVILHGNYGEDIPVNFNRPSKVYIWFQIAVTFGRNTNPPTNYSELIKDTVLNCMEDIGAGEDVVAQKFTKELYEKVSGIDYFDIRLYSTSNVNESPSRYTQRSADVSPRERAVTSESRIGVIIDA